MFAASKTSTASSGYQISRSLRFNSADSAYLNRTPASAGNRRTWTFSTWVKRSSLTSSNAILATVNGSAFNYFSFGTAVGDWLTFAYFDGAGDVFGVNTSSTSVFRDVSAWYHIVLFVDTTQATAANRVKIYVNNVEQTLGGTYPTQNYDTPINNSISNIIGGATGSYTGYLADQYMTEVNFIDGQALTPSSFGETNAQTGVWQPKAYSGSYGTNGFYLNFSDNSNTTAATLGKDYSPNGNNWTPNNFSVTAGAGNDSLVDSPTSYGTDTGVGGTVRGNYCTLNPVDTISTVTLANGNLDYTGSSGLSIATFGVSSGKWYWEHVIGAVDYCVIGIYQSGSKSMAYLGQSGVSIGIPNGGSPQYAGVSAPTGSLSAFTSADTIGFALDLDAGTFTVYKNNVSSLVFSGLTGLWFPAQAMNYSASGIYNFGQRPFAYTAPSGFKALCTQNLPTPTIGATTATQAIKYFNPATYTGNGSTNSITTVGFQPDWTWLKNRSVPATAGNHFATDAVRGAGIGLYPNLGDAEANNTTLFTGFTSTGFNVAGTNSSLNENGVTYVSWNWKANGSGSSNTSGSITSTVSANTTSGFSVVTYTGNGSNATVGHGLGVAPSMVIVKQRNTTRSWIVYNSNIGATKYLVLDSTNAAATYSFFWNDTAPTSSVFSIGTDGAVNTSGGTYVAYCFAEVAGYSKIGSYTGNGSTDGPFVFTGFRPAFVLVKKSDSGSESWVIVDTTRNTSNVMNSLLRPNTSDAEATATWIDALSNGFKCRETYTGLNASGGTYIYMAFASNPFKYSLAR
jgi:hypothetical protein